jgi:hypothetical protein
MAWAISFIDTPSLCYQEEPPEPFLGSSHPTTISLMQGTTQLASPEPHTKEQYFIQILYKAIFKFYW